MWPSNIQTDLGWNCYYFYLSAAPFLPSLNFLSLCSPTSDAIVYFCSFYRNIRFVFSLKHFCFHSLWKNRWTSAALWVNESNQFSSLVGFMKPVCLETKGDFGYFQRDAGGLRCGGSPHQPPRPPPKVVKVCSGHSALIKTTNESLFSLQSEQNVQSSSAGGIDYPQSINKRATLEEIVLLGKCFTRSGEIFPSRDKSFRWRRDPKAPCSIISGVIFKLNDPQQ